MAKAQGGLVTLLSFCFCLVAVFSQQLELYEDDICRQINNQLWTCKKLSQCLKAQEGLKNGRKPTICSFGSEPIVCCEPSERPPSSESKERISMQKCREYAKNVMISEEDSFEDDSFEDNSFENDYWEYYTWIQKHHVKTMSSDESPTRSNFLTGSTLGSMFCVDTYPHMALIGYGERDDIEWLSGGSLVSERFVLSAAHCSSVITTKGIRKVAGWVRLVDYRVFEIIERINHPDYKPHSIYNDIALFKLKHRVVFNKFVRPICLQTNHTFANTSAIATGWGVTKWGGVPSPMLLQAELTIVGRMECLERYKEVTSTKLRNGVVDATQLCADGEGASTCKGDSGGPLQILLTDPYCMYSQVGITSFGVKCSSEFPGIYTRVSHYVPWIESIVWPQS